GFPIAMVVLGAALEAHWLCGPTLLGGGGLAAEEVVLAGSRQLGDGGWPSQSVTPIWAQRVACRFGAAEGRIGRLGLRIPVSRFGRRVAPLPWGHGGRRSGAGGGPQCRCGSGLARGTRAAATGCGRAGRVPGLAWAAPGLRPGGLAVWYGAVRASGGAGWRGRGRGRGDGMPSPAGRGRRAGPRRGGGDRPPR